MKCLYIDTSSNYLYTAIVDKDEIINSVSEKYDQSLSEVALLKISNMFSEVNCNTKDIEKIIVVNGPGSFTGIRIGVTIAKVYAWGLNIPVTSITSLESMAVSTNINSYKVPIIDARRGFVFAAIYDEENNEKLKPQHIKLVDLEQKLSTISEYKYITNDELDLNKEKTKFVPNYLNIVNKFITKNNISPHALNPDYLKLTEAEESNK